MKAKDIFQTARCVTCRTFMPGFRNSTTGGSPVKCSPCRGYVEWRRAWVQTCRRALWPSGRRTGIVAKTWVGSVLVRFLSDTALSGRAETYHYSLVHLQEGRK